MASGFELSNKGNSTDGWYPSPKLDEPFESYCVILEQLLVCGVIYRWYISIVGTYFEPFITFATSQSVVLVLLQCICLSAILDENDKEIFNEFYRNQAAHFLPRVVISLLIYLHFWLREQQIIIKKYLQPENMEQLTQEFNIERKIMRGSMFFIMVNLELFDMLVTCLLYLFSPQMIYLNHMILSLLCVLFYTMFFLGDMMSRKTLDFGIPHQDDHNYCLTLILRHHSGIALFILALCGYFAFIQVRLPCFPSFYKVLRIFAPLQMIMVIIIPRRIHPNRFRIETNPEKTCDNITKLSGFRKPECSS